MNPSNKIAAVSVACYSIAGFFRYEASSGNIVNRNFSMFLFEAKKKFNVNFENQSPRNCTVEKLGSLNNIKGGEGLGHKKRISRNWRGIDCFITRKLNGFKTIAILSKLLYLKGCNALLNNLSKKYFFPLWSSSCVVIIGIIVDQINY